MWLLFALISVGCWSIALVLDSALVRNYEKHPVVLMWSQSIFSVVILLFASLLLSVETRWAPLLVCSGFIAYIGDLVLFRALNRLDVSVVNITWVLLSVFLVAGGFLLFGELWTLGETLGVILIISGVLYLSLAHEHVTFGALGLLVAIAVFYMPYYMLQKAALIDGDAILTVAFWMLIGREFLSFLFPWTVPRLRAKLKSLPQRVGPFFFVISALVILSFFLGVYFNVWAYQVGPMSLIAVVGNTEPFIVMFFAWMLLRMMPHFASKELLTRQSVQVKVVSYVVTFTGLALLVVS